MRLCISLQLNSFPIQTDFKSIKRKISSSVSYSHHIYNINRIKERMKEMKPFPQTGILCGVHRPIPSSHMGRVYYIPLSVMNATIQCIEKEVLKRIRIFIFHLTKKLSMVLVLSIE